MFSIPTLTPASILLGILGYVYFAYTWMIIAKKLDYDKPWLAWIPIANFALLPLLGGEKDWPWVFILIIPVLNIFWGFSWLWAIFKKRGYPGWLIFVLIVSVFFPNWIELVVDAILFGLVAFKDV